MRRYSQHIYNVYVPEISVPKELSYICTVIKKIEKSILLNRLASSCLLTKANFVWTTRKVGSVFKSDDDNNNNNNNINLYKILSLPMNRSLYGHFFRGNLYLSHLNVVVVARVIRVKDFVPLVK